MPKSSVVVVGRSRLAHELIGLAQAADYDAKLYPDADAAAISSSLVVETSCYGEARKHEILNKLDSGSPSAVILTSCPWSRSQRMMGRNTTGWAGAVMSNHRRI